MTRRQHAALRKFYIFNNHGPVLTGVAFKQPPLLYQTGAAVRQPPLLYEKNQT